MKHYITFRGVSKSFAPSKEKTDGSLRSKHEATVAGEKNTLQGGETSIRPRLWRVQDSEESLSALTGLGGRIGGGDGGSLIFF